MLELRYGGFEPILGSDDASHLCTLLGPGDVVKASADTYDELVLDTGCALLLLA